MAESHRTEKSVDKMDSWAVSTGERNSLQNNQRHNYGTLDKSRVGVEISRIKVKTPKNQTIRLESFDLKKGVPKEDTSCISKQIKNLEPLSHREPVGIYAKFNIPNNLKTSELFPSDYKNSNDMISEKLIYKQTVVVNTKPLNSSVDKINSKDPYIRFSVNDPTIYDVKSVSKPKKSLLGTNKNFMEPHIGQIYKENSGMMKKYNKTRLNLAELNDERIEIRDFNDEEQLISLVQVSDASNKQKLYSSNISNSKRSGQRESLGRPESLGVKIGVLTIELVSNWGSLFQIGLSQIKIFDTEMREIEIDKASLKLFNKNKQLVNSKLFNLVDNNVKKSNPIDMVILDYNPNTDAYTISLNYPIDTRLGFIVIWNLNEDPLKCVKGIKITLNKHKIYNGQMQQNSQVLTNQAKFLAVKLQNELNEEQFVQNINKRFMSDRMSSPRNKIGMPHLISMTKFKKTERRESDTALFDLSTPKNRLKAKNEFFDRTKTPSPLKKSFQNFGQFDSIKLVTKSSLNSSNKLKIFESLEHRKESNPANQELLKLQPIQVNKNNNILESCSSFHNLAQMYGRPKIPTLPLVDGLTLKILSNWDHKLSVGLNGIEVFNELGEKLKINHNNIVIELKNGKQSPKQKEYRLASDSLNTTDENKHWSHPVANNMPIVLRIRFDTPQKISLIRIWNYNCSRIHVAKGVKDVIITNYDGSSLLFAGRIRKASGLLSNPRKNFEAILFTMDKTIIVNVARNDWLYFSLSKKSITVVKRKIRNCFEEFINQRPTTSELEEVQGVRQMITTSIHREHTQAHGGKTRHRMISPAKKLGDLQESIGCTSLKMQILETWGHPSEFGFIGIEFYTIKNQKIPEDYYKINTKCKVMGEEASNLETDAKSRRQCCMRFKPNDENIVEFIFKSFIQISQMRIFNLGPSKKQSIKGLKRLSLTADNFPVTPEGGVYVKKGSNLEFMASYPQNITFPITQLLHNVALKPSPVMPVSSPTGFTVEFHLKCTYGDPYYIGLNGIEIFDILGDNLLSNINEPNFRIVANPPGIFILPSMDKDPRVVTNLYKPKPYIDNFEDVWLAPFAKYDESYNKNIIVVEFKNPVTLGVINIWNYTHTASRGVKELEVYIDGNLIYCGWINDAREKLISSIVFDDRFLKKRQDHIKIEPVADLAREITELDNEGNVLMKRRSEKSLSDFRPTTGFQLS